MDAMLFSGFGILAVAALLTVFTAGRLSRAVTWIAVMSASALFVTVAAQVLESGVPIGPIVIWEATIINASCTIRVDALSAVLLLVIAVIAVAATWFSMTYTTTMQGHERGFFPLFLLFICSMAGVVVVDDFFFFFIPWEVMALCSYGLVIFHKERQENLKAGFKYFFITHTGTMALFFGVVLLVQNGSGSFRFEEISRSLPGVIAAQPFVAHLALLLILLGFLVKAGAFPFGMWWLPDAHPAAPSPVSALLSGVMIKMGLYGILRVFFQLLPIGSYSFTWGVVIAAFGTLSLFFGTMSALMQHDSKRLLAYHSIGQVGYMLLGFGIGLACIEINPTIAAIGLIGGLFHLINHACFKGLLFLNAGTFEFNTSERDLNNLGGLGKFLPLTTLATVVASLSISGLPPFNGFASKWLLYHASIWSGGPAGLIFIFFGIAAIFISAVTLASFIKFMGSTVLGAPSPAVLAVKKYQEGPWLSVSQLFLALLCVGLGVFPHAGAWLGHAAATSLVQARVPSFEDLFGISSLVLGVRDDVAVVGLWSPVLTGLVLMAAFGLALMIRRLAGAKQRAVAVWSCGSVVAPEQLRFKADSYHTPFKKFARMLLPTLRISWRPKPWPVVAGVLNPDGWGYEPLAQGTLRLFRLLAKSHVGITQIYALWVVIGLVAAFLFFMLW
jgi:hydrogenase-4 component B